MSNDNIIFNGNDLSAQGFFVTAQNGVYDQAGAVVDEQYLPGIAEPSITLVRREMVSMSFKCGVVGSDHADLLSKLATLKGYLSPVLGFKAFTTTDLISTKRTFARCLGMPLSMETLPFAREAVSFNLNFVRFSYWEDASAVEPATWTSSPASINNTGQLPCYPTFTCTINSSQPTGFTLSNTTTGKSLTYSKNMSSGTVVIFTDPSAPDITYNGTRDFANLNSDSEFPCAEVGNNSFTFPDSTMEIDVSYRKRYE